MVYNEIWTKEKHIEMGYEIYKDNKYYIYKINNK